MPPYRMTRSTQSVSCASRDGGGGVDGVAHHGPVGQHGEQVVDQFRCGCREGQSGLAQASAVRTPAPPALVTIATRLAAGSGWACNSAAVSRSSPIERVAVCRPG